MKNTLIYPQVCRMADRLVVVMRQPYTHYGTTFPGNRLTSSHVSYLKRGFKIIFLEKKDVWEQ